MARSKQQIIECILNLLLELENESDDPKASSRPLEMLTIKECSEVVPGVSQHTIRKLVAQGHVQHIRTGEGKRGKILICKSSLLEYLSGHPVRTLP